MQKFDDFGEFLDALRAKGLKLDPVQRVGNKSETEAFQRPLPVETPGDIALIAVRFQIAFKCSCVVSEFLPFNYIITRKAHSPLDAGVRQRREQTAAV